MINDPIPDYIHGGYQDRLRGNRFASGATMNPLGVYGAVVYQKSYRSPDGSDLHLILFFPNEIHSDTHHNNGNPVMMSEIAAINLLGEGTFPNSGKWKPWFNGVIESLDDDITFQLDAKVDALMSAEMAQFKRRWNSAMRTKDARRITALFKEKIQEQRNMIERQKRIFKQRTGFDYGSVFEWSSDNRVHHMPDFWTMIPRNVPLSQRQMWVNDRRREYKKYVESTRSSIANRNRTVSQLLNQMQKSRSWFFMHRNGVVGDSRSMRSAMYAAEESGNTREANKYKMLSMAAIEPMAFGATARTILDKAGRNIQRFMIDCLLGAKAPDIVEKTKRNRRANGNPDSPPLNETGEFARSLQYVVIG